MPHKLLRLTEKLYNTPHLITTSSFDRVIGYLEDRNSGVLEMAVRDAGVQKDRYLAYNPDTRIGYISMDGPLTYIEYEGLCGPSGPSYQAIRDESVQLLESGAKVIVLDQSSPGGEAYMAFETARYIREQADNYGAKIIAYVDGLSASASYAFSAIADEIIMNPMAEVGSVGVVVKLRNMNKAMKEMGVEDTYVYAGKSKIPFDSEGNFSEETLSDIQRKVDILYDEFVGHVAQFRKISKESVIGTEAKTFLANDAIALGLADKQMTLEEFSNYLADIVERGDNMPIKNILGFKTKEDPLKMAEQDGDFAAQIESLKEQHSVELASFKEQLETLQAAFEEQGSALLQAKEVISQMEQQHAVSAKEMKLKERTNALAECMDADAAKVNALALEALDDDAFAVVLSGYQAQRKALEGSDLFKRVSEVGEENQPTAHQAVVDTATEATLALMRARGMLKDE